MEEETIKEVCSKAYKKMKSYSRLLTGMAKGVDIIAAEVCLEETEWEVVAAIPCYGQEANWDSTWQKRYWKILSNPRTSVVYITKAQHEKGCYFKRNLWMVKRCNSSILFMHDKNSGTGNTYRFLKERDKKVFVFDPKAKLWLD